MTENQKLREACNYIDALGGDSRSYRQALALPTAEDQAVYDGIAARYFADVAKTAAPADELQELPPLPSYARWEERIKTLMQQCGHPNSMSIYQAFKQFQNEFEHEMIAYARAALRAGDAVDGPLIDEGSKPALSPLSDKEAIALIEEHTNDDNVIHAHEAIDLIRSVERAHGIDAAMRKGQL